MVVGIMVGLSLVLMGTAKNGDVVDFECGVVMAFFIFSDLFIEF